MQYQIVLLTLIFTLSCQSVEKDAVNSEESVETIQDDTISINLKPLQSEAKSKLSEAEEISVLVDSIQKLTAYVPDTVYKRMSTIFEHAHSAKTALDQYPDFNNPAIRARISEIHTRSGLLLQQQNTLHGTDGRYNQLYKDLIRAYNNLIVQINELYVTIPEDLEQELAKGLETQDTTTVKKPI